MEISLIPSTNEEKSVPHVTATSDTQSVNINVLGLDLSLTSSGYAYASDVKNPDVIVGTIKTSLKSMCRLNHIKKYIESLIDSQSPTLICIEDYSYASKFAQHYLAELGGIIRLVCYNKGVKTLLVPPPTLKKFVTGVGNADKQIMLLKIYKKFGREFTDNNEADAYALCQLGLEIVSKPESELWKKIRVLGAEEHQKTKNIK